MSFLGSNEGNDVHVLQRLGTDFVRTGEVEEEEEEEEKELPPTFALAAKRVRAFDLSCRACGACGAGAGCWAWTSDFP